MIDEKLWPESPWNSQSCKNVDADSQCLSKYIRLGLNYPVESGRKEKIQSLPNMIGLYVKMRITKILTKLMPVRMIHIIKSFKMLCSIAYYRKCFEVYSKTCGKEVQIHRPISIRGMQYMSIGDYFKLDVGSILEAWDEHNGFNFIPSIEIGNNVSLGKNCHIGCVNRVRIGDNVLGGNDILIIDHNHGMSNETDIYLPPNKRKLSSHGEIVIGDNVWIGDKVTILAGIHIGNNCVVGANTVVTKDIPDNCVVVGNPSRIIRTN